LLIVEITESDLQSLQRPSPSDRDVARVIANLQKHQPRVIGLDLYQELSQPPGQVELEQQLRDPRLIAIMLLGEEGKINIPGPAVVPPERIGFNDLPIDPDNTIRRNLILAWTGSDYFYSFGLRVALKYLADDNLLPQTSLDKNQYLQIGDVTLPKLRPNSGGYQNADSAGYQILLNYRSRENVARSISFTDVLTENFNPEWVRAKIVLIGVTAPSSRDLYRTPYTTGQINDGNTAGVIIHAHMVSHLLNIIQDEESLFYFFPEWAEILWILGWVGLGSGLARYIRRPLLIIPSGILVAFALVGISYGLFLQFLWIPIVTPLVIMFVTMLSVRSYQIIRDYQINQLVRYIKEKNK
jgi:CHASE2 domain-containing sensor protein